MRIENIIEDIKKDIKELGTKLEGQFSKQNPGLNFSVSLPGLEELVTVKSIALTIVIDHVIYYLSVIVHTHNDNRVFENDAIVMINGQPVPYRNRHPYQDRFVDMLRDIIKREKKVIKSGNKLNALYRARQLVNMA